MLASVEKSPAKLTWVLLVVVEGVALGAQQTDALFEIQEYESSATQALQSTMKQAKYKAFSL